MHIEIVMAGSMNMLFILCEEHIQADAEAATTTTHHLANIY